MVRKRLYSSTLSPEDKKLTDELRKQFAKKKVHTESEIIKIFQDVKEKFEKEAKKNKKAGT